VTGRSAEVAETLSELGESHGGVEGSTGVAVGCGAVWPPAATYPLEINSSLN